MARCQDPTCNRPIRFVILVTSGLTMPLDPKPETDGTVAIIEVGEKGRMSKAVVLSKARRQSWTEPLYRPHFATCPGADAFRTRQRIATP